MGKARIARKGLTAAQELAQTRKGSGSVNDKLAPKTFADDLPTDRAKELVAKQNKPNFEPGAAAKAARKKKAARRAEIKAYMDAKKGAPAPKAEPSKSEKPPQFQNKSSKYSTKPNSLSAAELGMGKPKKPPAPKRTPKERSSAATAKTPKKDSDSTKGANVKKPETKTAPTPDPEKQAKSPGPSPKVTSTIGARMDKLKTAGKSPPRPKTSRSAIGSRMDSLKQAGKGKGVPDVTNTSTGKGVPAAKTKRINKRDLAIGGAAAATGAVAAGYSKATKNRKTNSMSDYMKKYNK